MKRKDGDLYLLLDGTYADPKDCSAGKDGVLKHKNGVGVALRDDGEPMTLSRSVEHNAKAAEAGQENEAGSEPLATTEIVAAAPKDKPASS